MKTIHLVGLNAYSYKGDLYQRGTKYMVDDARATILLGQQDAATEEAYFKLVSDKAVSDTPKASVDTDKPRPKPLSAKAKAKKAKARKAREKAAKALEKANAKALEDAKAIVNDIPTSDTPIPDVVVDDLDSVAEADDVGVQG